MFSSRGYTTGMFFGKQADSDYNFDGESYRMSHELVGIILEVHNNTARVTLRNRLDRGDEVEFLSPGLEGKRFRIEEMQDTDGFSVSSARNEETISLQVPEGVRKNDLIRRDKAFRGSGKALEAAGDIPC
jgi:putative protease